MRVRVTHDLDDLTKDMVSIARKAGGDMAKVVRAGAIAGNTEAKDNARRSSGTHGKHYPKAFTWEMRSAFHSSSGSTYMAEYGPDISRPQGGMSFEGGSINQPPHNDLAKSADLIGPSFHAEVSRLPDKWFW